jgi:hypothetical protein
MTRSDFLNLVRAAKTEKGELSESAPLDGIALHGERRMVSMAGAVSFIRWQALQFDGLWDTEELERCAVCFRRVDLVQ